MVQLGLLDFGVLVIVWLIFRPHLKSSFALACRHVSGCLSLNCTTVSKIKRPMLWGGDQFLVTLPTYPLTLFNQNKSCASKQQLTENIRICCSFYADREREARQSFVIGCSCGAAACSCEAVACSCGTVAFSCGAVAYSCWAVACSCIVKVRNIPMTRVRMINDYHQHD